MSCLVVGLAAEERGPVSGENARGGMSGYGETGVKTSTSILQSEVHSRRRSFRILGLHLPRLAV